MKKLLAVCLFLVVCLGATCIMAETYPAKKVFTGSGSFQRYVNFSFIVPTGSCGQVETFQHSPAFPFHGIKAEWKKLTQGDQAAKGHYRVRHHRQRRWLDE